MYTNKYFIEMMNTFISTYISIIYSTLATRQVDFLSAMCSLYLTVCVHLHVENLHKKNEFLFMCVYLYILDIT